MSFLTCKNKYLKKKVQKIDLKMHPDKTFTLV